MSLSKDLEKLSDWDVWVLACGAVSVAGLRAATTKRDDVNLVCMRFVKEMAELVGTPSFPEPKKEQR